MIRLRKLPKDFIMSRSERYFTILEKLALSISYQSQHRARIASCIVYKNDIISFGINQMKSHPFQARFSRNVESIYLHSETNAINNALKIITTDELSKSSLYICRVKYDGKNIVWGISKPCIGCMRAIAAFDIKKVFYTCEGNIFNML